MAPKIRGRIARSMLGYRFKGVVKMAATYTVDRAEHESFGASGRQGSQGIR